MSESDKTAPGRSWSGQRRLSAGLNVVVSLFLAATVAVLLNIICARFVHYRSDVSAARFYSISEKTRKVLGDLKAEVRVHVIFRGASGEHDDTIYDIMSLLDEYRYYVASINGPKFRVERIDPDRDLARAKRLGARLKLEGVNTVVFEVNGRTKIVPEKSIVAYDYEIPSSGVAARRFRKEFLGEQVFTSAIIELTQERKPIAYFVSGHGERDPTDSTPGEGFSRAAAAMRMDNIEIRTICMTERHAIPGDCDLLVIAGPRNALHRSEVGAVSAFLRANRSLLVMAEAGYPTGLEGVLEEWGVMLSPDRVVEKTYAFVVGSNGVVGLPHTGEELYVRHYGEHAVTRGMEDMTTVFYSPRAVFPAAERSSEPTGRDSRDKARVSALASCTGNGWAETQFDEDPPKYDPETDRAGPVQIAVAVERGPVTGMKVALGSTKIVVIGDTDFVADDMASGGNMDFFMNSVNWLLRRDSLVSIGPKAYGSVSLRMDEKQSAWLFMAIVAGIPSAVFLAGLAVWLSRVR